MGENDLNFYGSLVPGGYVTWSVWRKITPVVSKRKCWNDYLWRRYLTSIASCWVIVNTDFNIYPTYQSNISTFGFPLKSMSIMLLKCTWFNGSVPVTMLGAWQSWKCHKGAKISLKTIIKMIVYKATSVASQKVTMATNTTQKRMNSIH